jgi:hypothetical protein
MVKAGRWTAGATCRTESGAKLKETELIAAFADKAKLTDDHLLAKHCVASQEARPPSTATRRDVVAGVPMRTPHCDSVRIPPRFQGPPHIGGQRAEVSEYVANTRPGCITVVFL